MEEKSSSIFSRGKSENLTALSPTNVHESPIILFWLGRRWVNWYQPANHVFVSIHFNIMFLFKKLMHFRFNQWSRPESMGKWSTFRRFFIMLLQAFSDIDSLVGSRFQELEQECSRAQTPFSIIRKTWNCISHSNIAPFTVLDRKKFEKCYAIFFEEFKHIIP